MLGLLEATLSDGNSKEELLHFDFNVDTVPFDLNMGAVIKFFSPSPP